jgi:hypothetical protein
MFGLKEELNDYNYDMCGMVSYTISDKNIRYRCYPYPTSSVFDPRLFIFVFENICICIRSYPYSNSNPNKNMKTNMISLIFVRIRSDYTPTRLSRHIKDCLTHVVLNHVHLLQFYVLFFSFTFLLLVKFRLSMRHVSQLSSSSSSN